MAINTPNNQGAWLVGTTYHQNDVVTRDDGTYVALSTTTGNDPATDGGVHWQQISSAESGGPGSSGPAIASDSAPVALTSSQNALAAAPAGGTGAAAGAWDTAGHRDTAIALINGLQTSYNAAQADIVALQAELAAVTATLSQTLAELRSAGIIEAA